MKKPKEENLRLNTLKSMLEYHRENPRKRTLINELQKKIDYIEKQEEAKQRELKIARTHELEMKAINTPTNSTKSFKVVTQSKTTVFYGTLKKCSAFLVKVKNDGLTIKRNK
jgi:hypothetical protein